ncbi:MAG: sulfatase [Planctomycetaceae bacterium]|nr:sulfatase [Planctomycetaceae bacterium]
MIFAVLVFFAGVSCSATVVASDSADGQPNRFNVLLICVDDLRPELGCYGVQHGQSPSLDAFAQTARRFDRHYVMVPTCGASRYAMLTGRSPAASGVTRSNEAFYNGPSALTPGDSAAARTLPELFRRSGYTTVGIGKISHTPDGRVFAYNGNGDGRPELPGAWDRMGAPYGPWERGWGIFFAYPNGHHREDGLGHADLMDFTVAHDSDLPDGQMADDAVHELKTLAEAGNPFFLAVGFFKPHLPWVAPKQDWDAIDPASITAPESDADAAAGPYHHRSGEFFRYNMPFPKTSPLSEEASVQARRAYLACVRYADRQVGRVLKALDESGQADRTIVVVSGDHGWHLGEQQIWGKHTPWERALRSTLLIRVPGEPGGTASNAIVQSIDLMPTLIDYCQPRSPELEHPADGRSLRTVLHTGQDASPQPATGFWGKAISVRDEQRRYVITRGRTTEDFTNVEVYDMTAGDDGVRVDEPIPPHVPGHLQHSQLHTSE